MHRMRLSITVLVAAAALGAACGGETATTRTTVAPSATTTSSAQTSAPTTSRAASTTSRAATTTTGKATSSSTATLEAPASIGAYNKVEVPGQNADDLAKGFGFSQGAAGFYGRAELPEYIVVVGSSNEVKSKTPEQVFGDVVKGLGQSGFTIDEASKVQEINDGVTFSCATFTAAPGASAMCLAQQDDKLGIVLSIPGVGPTDVKTALNLAEDLVDT